MSFYDSMQVHQISISWKSSQHATIIKQACANLFASFQMLFCESDFIVWDFMTGVPFLRQIYVTFIPYKAAPPTYIYLFYNISILEYL